MTKRLLIDASHAEETRVVVLDGNRLEDFDVETQSRRQLKGNIYLAKVVRVEPSLQAAFVEYGGNRHGFLAFGEIHPDYFQIPVADRQRLIAMQEEEARAEDAEEENESRRSAALESAPSDTLVETAPESDQAEVSGQPETEPVAPLESQPLIQRPDIVKGEQEHAAEPPPLGTDTVPEAADLGEAASETPADQGETGSRVRQIEGEDVPSPEMLGGEQEGGEDGQPARQASRFIRNYKIQEVIRRRQILLIQIVKEERGTKGAALTTYISLAGRYCVLMPNSPRGGGISRKITSAADRRRLKEITAELEIPRGMGLIVRTAGAARPKPEIKRDGEYLLRLWDDIREQTMASMAPSLIYEEASLIKRAIRDVYSRDVDELVVDGEDGWRAARDYMRMLMPTHVKKVQLWPANAQPLFAHSQVESMLDSMLNPTVQLRSGGYLVINQTEALVAIDVNSGRSTRERGIEETALRTNLEAAEEAARQLRLRDLAGLIVIDFIDMESKKHNAMVERRMADALRNDRARIQIGHISHFGLLELSRQRLRPSLAETSLNVCAHCGGTGHVRSTESAALHVLREIEEEGGKRRAAEILVHVAGSTALFILNNKRQRLTEIELRYGMRVSFAADESLLPAQTRIDRLRAAVPQDTPLPVFQPQSTPDDDADEADIAEDEDDVVFKGQAEPSEASNTGDFTSDADHVPGETAAEGEQRRKRRRRRRRGGRREEGPSGDSVRPMADGAEQPDIAYGSTADAMPVPVPGHDEASEAVSETDASDVIDTDVPLTAGSLGEEPVRAKRGRRGGRRRRKPGEEAAATNVETGDGHQDAPAPTAPVYVPPAYVPYAGPTPADPFALSGLDIFDALEQAEQRLETVVIAEAPQPPIGLNGANAILEPQEADEPTTTLEAVSEPAKPAEPVPAPLIQPVVIGSTEAKSPAKKGWWRR